MKPQSAGRQQENKRPESQPEGLVTAHRDLASVPVLLKPEGAVTEWLAKGKEDGAARGRSANARPHPSANLDAGVNEDSKVSQEANRPYLAFR